VRLSQLRTAMVLVVLLVAACGGSGHPPDPLPVALPGTEAPPASVPTPAPTSATPTTTPPGTTSTSTTTTRPAATVTTGVAIPQLDGVGAAGQAIVVTAPSAGATTATLTAFERMAAGWRAVLGPWTAQIGSRGMAAPGAKREGDGRTPSGVHGFEFMFGVAPDPGVRFPYRRVTSRSIVWDDNPASPLYNTWVDLDRQQAGAEPEPMYVSPAYDHGAVIAYNTARTPGLGSAIFLHVSTGRATAGCVSLPAGQLIEVLRWLDPTRGPRIVLGIAA